LRDHLGRVAAHAVQKIYDGALLRVVLPDPLVGRSQRETQHGLSQRGGGGRARAPAGGGWRTRSSRGCSIPMIPASGRCAAAAARCSRRARSCARLDSRGALARGAGACLPSPLRAED